MHIPRAFCMVHRQEMTILTTGLKLEVFLKEGDSYYKVSADEFHCPGWECKIVIPARSEIAANFQAEYSMIQVDAAVSLK